nr:hypothetical protein [Oxalobacteraceae bacterium]
MRTMSQAQYAVLQDLRRMRDSQGRIRNSQVQHLDGRTLRGLERRGLIESDHTGWRMTGA